MNILCARFLRLVVQTCAVFDFIPINVRKYRRDNQEWRIQRILKGQPRMENPENLWTTKNGQSREVDTRRYRILKGQPRMENPENLTQDVIEY